MDNAVLRPLHLAEFSRDASAAEIKEVTDRDGGAIVKGFVPEETLARINSELDPVLAGEDPSQGYSDDENRAAFYGRRTKRLQAIVRYGNAIIEPMLSPLLLDWAAQNLTWGTEIQYNNTQVIEIGPGEPAQLLHRDEDLWPEALAVAPGEFTVSAIVALSDFSEELGATRVVPGTHRDHSRPPRMYSPDDTIPAVMSAGDALFFTGSLVHGGGANRSAATWRRAVSLSFVVGWIRAEESYNLAIPLERMRELPPKLRELLSFASYRAELGDLGTVDMVDPYSALFGDERPPRVRG